MGTTLNYGIPYPECAPPLRKDASDIADFYDLAIAADTALDGVYDLAFDWVFTPDAVRMASGAAVAAVGQNVTPFYSSASISQGNGMADISNGWVNIVEPGRYWIAAYVSMTAVGMTSVRTRFLLNGVAESNFQTPGFAVNTNTAIGQSVAVLSVTQPNTALQTQGRHSSAAALAYTYTSRLWCVQLEKF
jgi:hypothetical protein